MDQLAFESSISLISALFIGIATAIAPCTFATNVAAISYIAHYVDNPKKAFMTAVSFTLGRMATYVALGAIMISAGRVVGSIARDTQSYGNLIIGPVLIVIGFAFTGAFSLNFSWGNGVIADRMPSLAKKGVLGAFVLGAMFAVAFCPYSGMLFFGMLIPLSISSSYGVVLPGIFGIGVSLPVILFSILIYFSASRARSFGKAITASWKYIGRSLGLIIIVVGCYSVAPYLAEWYGISYAFELITLLFCSAAVYRMLGSMATLGERPLTKPVASAPRMGASVRPNNAQHAKRDDSGGQSHPPSGGIPRKM